jgi:hypothetical protein
MHHSPYRSRNYGSHMAVLTKVFMELPEKGDDVVELGTGIYSTPLMHWLSLVKNRNLYSYDHDKHYFDLFNIPSYKTNFHKVFLINDWDEVFLEKPWDIVFVDHDPGVRRSVDIMRVVNWAKYIIVHDSGWWDNKYYHLKEKVFPFFKYRYDYRPINNERTMTSVLSNLVDLKDFKI